jgi:hypothetical protein
MVESTQNRFEKIKLLSNPQFNAHAHVWLVRWNGGPNDKKLLSVLKIPKNGAEGYR